MKRALGVAGIVVLLLAERGSGGAPFNLGIRYPNDMGVLHDPAEGLRRYREAAEQGDTAAQLKLGHAYAGGEGVPQDYAEAVKWYGKAAEQGLPEAQLALGAAHRDGQGVPLDLVQAHKWFHLAAESGGGREQGARRRDEVAAKMTAAQISQAQKLAREWQEQFEKRKPGK